MVHFHLLREVLLTPLIFVYVVPDEADGLFPGDFDAWLTFLMVIDP